MELINGARNEICTFHGQIDLESGRPTGIGIAINEQGHIHEGLFYQGEKRYPYLRT